MLPGKITFDSEHKVSGDAFFELSDGEAAFPLGTVTIRETKAPDGYLTEDEVVVRKDSSGGNSRGCLHL